ncbi:MAG: heme o synthase [Phycisphaerales bacterium]
MSSVTRTIPSETILAPELAVPSRFSDVIELTKARLVTMVLVTTAVGYLLAEVGPVRWAMLALTLIGAGLAAGAAMALNQYLEVDADARMERTRERPLPARRMSESMALLAASTMGIGGTALLLLAVDPLAAILAGGNIVLYAFVYTPLKRRTSFNTLVGAVTGGIPPMIGWAAASGTLDRGAWLLGAILFLWQIPHFLALAWLYREDYRRGGFVMLPTIDTGGSLTACVVVLSTLSLTPLALMAVLGGLAGPPFALVAVLLGAGFAGLAFQMLRDRSDRAARRVFLASLLYLPLLLGALVVDHERTMPRLRGDVALEASRSRVPSTADAVAAPRAARPTTATP